MMDTRGEKLLATKKDIDTILAEKFDIPLEVAQANTNYIVKRLVELQKQEDVFKIYLSKNLGYMYCTQNMLHLSRKKLTNFEGSERVKVLDEKIRKVTETEFKRKVNRKKVLKPPRFNRRWFRNNKTKKELEDFQNNFYNEQKGQHN